MKRAMTEPITVEMLIMKTPCNKQPIIAFLYHANNINREFMRHYKMVISRGNWSLTWASVL